MKIKSKCSFLKNYNLMIIGGVSAIFIGLYIYIYSFSVWNDFVRDDRFFIKYEYIDNTFSLKNIVYYFLYPTYLNPIPKGKIYRPLIQISFMFNYWLSGENPYSYHIFNIILHLLNSILIFILLKLLLKKFKEDWSISPEILSFIGALIYLFHPLNSQVVLYIHARTCSLYTFFYLISFILYIKKYYLLASFIYIFSLFSKETSVTLILVLIIYEYFFNFYKKERKFYEWLKSVTIKLFPFILFLIIYLIIRKEVIGFSTVRKINLFNFKENLYNDQRNIIVNIITQLGVLIRYIYLYLIPIPLNIEYDFRPICSLLDNRLIFIIIFYLILIWIFFKSNKNIKFIILFFYATHIVTIIVPLYVIVNEHRMYIPIISLIILSLYLIDFINKKINKKFITSLLISLLIISYSIRILDRCKDWKNIFTLYSSAYKRKLSYRFSIFLSSLYEDKKEYKKVISIIKKECKKRNIPLYYFSLTLSKCYINLKKYNLAEKYLKIVKTIRENYDKKTLIPVYLMYTYLEYYRNNLSKIEEYKDKILNLKYKKIIAIYREGKVQIERAITSKIRKWFERYVKKETVDSSIYFEISKYFLKKKKLKKTLELLKMSIKLNPYIPSYILLGQIFKFYLNNPDLGVSFYKKGFLLSLINTKKERYSGKGCYKVIQYGILAKEYKKVLNFINNELKKRPLEYYLYLGKGDLYFYQNKYKKAIKNYKKAISLYKKKKEAYERLINIYKILHQNDKVNKYFEILYKLKMEDIKYNLRLKNIYY